jgi:hypothetical protein
MADAPAYTTVPGKLPGFLTKIRETGVPAKATKSWLESLGFKSSNDRSMLNVLRQIGFIDASNTPTPAWREYRGADHKAVLGRAIQLGYQDLYATYSDAQDQTNTDLGHFFSTRSTAGKQAIEKMVSTFKALAGQAEFASEPATTVATPESMTTPANPVETPLIARTTSTRSGLSVNINVALTLPETTDDKVYEAFFKAMHKHLLSDDTS